MRRVDRFLLFVVAAFAAAVVAAVVFVASSSAALRPAHRALWLCVHAREHSSWHDPAAPYWGGLQMGAWFISHYGARLPHPAGTPDRWTPLEQMTFAEGAYRIEGYSRAWLAGQWPPSRGRCF